MDAIIAADRVHRDHMEHGSQLLKNAILRARGKRPETRDKHPSDLIWHHRPCGVNWIAREDSYTTRHQVRRAELLEQRDRLAEINRVNRDPCPMCAVRADVGCRHRRAA